MGKNKNDSITSYSYELHKHMKPCTFCNYICKRVAIYAVHINCQTESKYGNKTNHLSPTTYVYNVLAVQSSYLYMCSK